MSDTEKKTEIEIKPDTREGVSYQDFWNSTTPDKGDNKGKPGEAKVNQPAGESKQPEGSAETAAQVNQDESQSNEQTEETPEPTIYDLEAENYSAKLGDRQLTRQEIEQALKDKENKETWVANLTNKSKLVSWVENLPPEQQERFISNALLYVHGKEKLPDDFKQKPLEFDVQVKSDDFDELVKGKHVIQPGTDEYKAMQEYFYNQFKKEHESLFLELQQHQTERKKFEQEKTEYERTETSRELSRFIGEHSIDFPTEGDLMKNIEAALLNDTSPYRDSAILLTSLAQVAENFGLDSLDAAYEKVYGTSLKTKAGNNQAGQQTQNALKNQKGVKPETPGQTPPVKSKDDQWREKHYFESPMSQRQRNFSKLLNGEFDSN